MTYINHCNICNSKIISKYKLPFRDVIGMSPEYTQEVCLCPECGFIFTANPFSAKQLENRYKNNSKFEFDKSDYFLTESDDYKRRSIRQKFFLENNCDFNHINSILEIGSASGYNLSLYSDRNPYGVEPSAFNCQNALKKYGIKMFNGVFDDFYKIVSQEYDLIFLSHVLEHIVNPCDFIKKCSHINTQYIFIEVPTFDYKFIDEPFGMFAEEHVNMFTLESIQNLMNACGYKLINANMIFGIEQTLPAGWPAISTLWQKSDTCKYHEPVMKSEQLLDNYIKCSIKGLEKVQKQIAAINNTRKLAIWGTGHHASMLLANSELSQKNIVKVYDSDRKKSGILFAGIPITPFDEKDITEHRIDTILLATYTAQKALLKILEPYQNQIEIITLYNI